MAAGDAPAARSDTFAQGIVEIVGPDFDRLLGFYLDAGFELMRRTDSFAVVHWRGQRLFLAGNPDAPAAPRWCNLRIMVDDVDALCGQLLARGIDAKHPPTDQEYGLRDFVIADPAGFEIRFAEPLPELL